MNVEASNLKGISHPLDERGCQVSDNLEVLYDIDIKGKGMAESNGLKFARAGMPNSSPELISALVSVVRRSKQ